MTLELTSEQEALVLHFAEQSGKTPVELVVLVMSHLECMDDAEENTLIAERIAEADSGVGLISHKEVGRRLGSIR